MSSSLLARAGAETVSIVIPAYNEEGNLDVVLDAAVEVLSGLTSRYEVVVVDDMSSDRTLEIAESHAMRDARIKVLRTPRVIGCNPALLMGLAQAGGDLMFFIPGDQQVMPDQLLPCLEAIRDVDIVCTYRLPRRDPMHRRLIGRAYNWGVRTLFKLDVRDVDSVFLIRRRVLESVIHHVESDSGFIPVELLYRARRNGFKIREIRIEHHPRVAGKSTGLSVSEAVRALVGLAKFWRSIRRGPA